MLEIEYKKLYSEEKENFKYKPVIKNLGVEEDAWKHDGYKSPSLLIEDEDLSEEPEKIHENNLFNLVKYTTFKKPLKKLIKKQLWFGKHSYHFWKEIHYKYFVKKYVPNNLPINCSDTILTAEKVEYNNEIIPFNYQKKDEWKENLESYLKMLRTRASEKETLLTFQDKGMEDFVTELKKVRTVVDHLDDIENINEIEYKNKHLYLEPKSFQKIEKLWKNETYDDVIYECRKMLLYFVDRYQEENNGKRWNIDKNKHVLEEFISQISADYEIKGLSEYLKTIIKQFGELRNNFGKGEPGLSLDEKKEIEILYKKINTRMIIDLSRTIHNLLKVLVNEKKLSK